MPVAVVLGAVQRGIGRGRDRGGSREGAALQESRDEPAAEA